MSDCKTCLIINEIVPFHKKYTAPASKRAWERTKCDFHAGYSKACEDMAKRLNNAIKAMR